MGDAAADIFRMRVVFTEDDIVSENEIEGRALQSLAQEDMAARFEIIDLGPPPPRAV